MAMKPEVNTPLILTIGAVSALLLIVIGIGTQAWFQNEERREIDAKWDAPSSVPVGSLAIENGNAAPVRPIDDYRWVDKEHAVAAIPISEAMRMMVESKGNLPTTQPTVGEGTSSAPASAPASRPGTGPENP